LCITRLCLRGFDNFFFSEEESCFSDCVFVTIGSMRGYCWICSFDEGTEIDKGVFFFSTAAMISPGVIKRHRLRKKGRFYVYGKTFSHPNS
uniref:hypothetical protein n=1 Tax=Odoribacter laneus TaxID=626933 RepID=UPI0040388DE2